MKSIYKKIHYQKMEPEVEKLLELDNLKDEKAQQIIKKYKNDFIFKCLVNEILLDSKISLHLDFKEQILLLSSEQIDELLKS